jgi:hypothetical protein
MAEIASASSFLLLPASHLHLGIIASNSTSAVIRFPASKGSQDVIRIGTIDFIIIILKPYREEWERYSVQDCPYYVL